MLPFAIFGLAYRLAAGHSPSLEVVLGHGELFIPSSVMNAEAVWTFSYVILPGRAVWYPFVAGACGLAALGGAVCFGIVAALEEAPHGRVTVAPSTLQQLAKTATVLSAGEFVMALLIGTTGIVMFMLVKRREGSAA